METQNIVVTQNVSELRSKRRRRKRRRGFALGILISFFTLIGIITVAASLVNYSTEMFTKTQEKEEWENYVLPVVMANMTPFTDINTLDMSEILYTTMWSVVVNDDLSKYPLDMDFGTLQIPASALNQQAKYLFGEQITLEHMTFTVDNIDFYIYDDELESYTINTDVNTDMYTATVTEIRRNEIKSGDSPEVDPEGEDDGMLAEGISAETEIDTLNGDLDEDLDETEEPEADLDDIYPVVLTVGYVPPGSIWEMNLYGEKYEPEPDVYRKIYIDYDEEGEMFIAGIKDVPKDGETNANLPEDPYEDEMEEYEAIPGDMPEQYNTSTPAGADDGLDDGEEDPDADGEDDTSSSETEDEDEDDD